MWILRPVKAIFFIGMSSPFREMAALGLFRTDLFSFDWHLYANHTLQPACNPPLVFPLPSLSSIWSKTLSGALTLLHFFHSDKLGVKNIISNRLAHTLPTRRSLPVCRRSYRDDARSALPLDDPLSLKCRRVIGRRFERPRYQIDGRQGACP
ncbi:hypothetical protein PAMP_023052 [Pampus punctatissimus]